MLRNEIVYQIFPRNYSQEGTFKAIENDLERIKSLGVDIIYLTPIHEIGELRRKGTYGSPYSIRDYFSITKDYGTLNDFISLVNSIHKMNMRIIIDMVFNHTSYDNVLINTHPEYYFYRNGKLANRVGDWSDIADLDTSRIDTQEYLLSVLKNWVNKGVDGFRFDVASMIPLEFFKKARKELGKEIIFIGESIDPGFVAYLKSINDNPTPDEDMFPTFDSLYNYSWYRSLMSYLKKDEGSSIDKFIEEFNKDNSLLNNKGIRLNCLENHDNERIASLVSGEQLMNLLDFFAYIKGQLFIYAGQEYGNKHKPELFEKDPILWEKDDIIFDKYIKIIKDKKEQKAIDYQLIEKIDKHSIKVNSYIRDIIVDSKAFEF